MQHDHQNVALELSECKAMSSRDYGNELLGCLVILRWVLYVLPKR